jgi:magnesium-transporting ATPase (P-type)
MVVLGVALRFVQETRADSAAARLKAMVRNTATVVRDGREQEVPLGVLVPGDIIRLAAGDMVPADSRVLAAKDLFLNQAALTGEALPVEKHPGRTPADRRTCRESGRFSLPPVWSGTACEVLSWKQLERACHRLAAPDGAVVLLSLQPMMLRRRMQPRGDRFDTVIAIPVRVVRSPAQRGTARSRRPIAHGRMSQ